MEPPGAVLPLGCASPHPDCARQPGRQTRETGPEVDRPRSIGSVLHGTRFPVRQVRDNTTEPFLIKPSAKMPSMSWNWLIIAAHLVLSLTAAVHAMLYKRDPRAALGWVAADRFMALYSSDLFTLPLHLPWWALALAALGVVLAAALSQLPAVRAVRRLDVARVVRERAM